MDTEKDGAGKTGSAAGEGNEELELEVSGETEDQEELYDKDGKPLPWNQSKRFRKLYGEAKEGRKLQKALSDLGLKSSADIPKLHEALGRLQQYDRAYAQYQEEVKRGTTDDDDDEGAKEVQKRIKTLKSQLKSLGVKFSEDEEEETKSREQSLEARKQEIIGRTRDRISELLEDAGVDLKSMSKEDSRDLLEEIELKIGQKLGRDEEGKAAFVRGSLRPIEKYFKEVVAKANLPIKKGTPKGTGITQLPPRMSGSHTGSAIRRQDNKGPMKVKDVTEEIVADLKARNAARRAEQE